MNLRSFFFFVLFAWTPFCFAKEFVIRYQTLTSGSLYRIETKEGERIGKVVRESRDSKVSYTFYNTREELLAMGPVEGQQGDTYVKLTDGMGKEIGKFTALIPNLYPTEYKIFQNECCVAKGLMNWLGNNFVLFDPESPRRQFVSYFRPFFKLFNDNWHFDIHEDRVIAFSLLCIIGAFQTACDLNFEMLEPKTIHYQ